MASTSLPSTATIESFLFRLLDGLSLPEPRGRGRPRILPALALWTGLLVCVVRKQTRQLDLWRLLTGSGLDRFPHVAISDEAVYKRLATAGTAPLVALFEHVTAVLAARLAPLADTSLAPFARGVYALDATTLDQVARLLPDLRGVPKGDRRLLPGKLSALFDLRTQQFVRIQHHPDPAQNDKVAARAMVADLPRGSLLLADLGYFAFAWFDDLTAAGYHWISRLRQKTSTRTIHVYYDRGGVFDGLVWLGAYRADKGGRAVRLVRFNRGGTTFTYITNVRDPAVLPLREMARLYARRWDVELAFKLIKQHLGLHVLWSAKEVVLLQQVWGVLIIAQILQGLRLEIAQRAGADPFEVSMALLVQYLPQYLFHSDADPVARFVAYGRQLRFIRPSSRLVIVAPDIPPDQIIPCPSDLILERTPRSGDQVKAANRAK
jgi:hypothetical protein